MLKVEELLPYCKFYDGKETTASAKQDKRAFALVTVEGNVVDLLTDYELKPGENLSAVFEQHLVALIKKWYPNEFDELWAYYKAK